VIATLLIASRTRIARAARSLFSFWSTTMTRLAFKLSLALVLASTSFASADRVAADPPATAAQMRIAPPVIDRAKLRAKLLENRRANIARFHAYRVAGVYPSNVFTDSLTNVWRDQQGHFCAAATIIRASGAVELVDRIAEDDNFFRIADVEQGLVLSWILTSGLTQEELVMIQKPFSPVTSRPEIEPSGIVKIDPKLRAAETRRLAKLYREIEAKLVRNQRANLDTAVDRLMHVPVLARQVLDS
jgi:hypothetical protein